MKRFFSLFSLIAIMVFAMPDAHAKKFGGGKSFGKSYKTAPAPKSQPSNTDSIQKQNTPAGKSSMAKGLMGGMLGGLLAGGLIGALLSGGFDGFDGLQIMDFLIIALIAFALFKIFKLLMASKNKAAMAQSNQQAYATAQPQPQAQQKSYYHENNNEDIKANTTMSSFAQSNHDVPFNFPPNFDQGSFVEGAREHYRILQKAWDHNQLETIKEYVSADLYQDLVKERNELSTEQQTDVLFVDAKIVRADHNATLAQLSLQFTGRYCDRTENKEEDISDIWHLERDLQQANAPWLIVGIQA